jgi:hypothetical protein
MRVLVDLTNSPHVLVLRPVVALLRERGAEVHVTARDFAQTVGPGGTRIRRDPALLVDLLTGPVG